MNAIIISIGDEVLIGQVVNSNAAWIASALTRLGVTVCEHRTIGDQPSALKAAIADGMQCAEVVVMTGGLGPTHDDITKWVLADFMQDQIVESPEWVTHLERWMKERGRELSDRNRRQALLPQKATILPNELGTAPGLLYNIDNGILCALPGVPNEMRHIVTESILPLLASILEQTHSPLTQYSTVLTTGIAESTLADVLGEPESFLGDSTLAFLPNYHGVRLRIGVTAQSAHDRERERMRIASYIRERAGTYVFGHDDETLAMVVGRDLQNRGETVAVAESCTGGLLGAAFTDVPGCSAWFAGGIIAYANAVKVQELGVSEYTLETHGAVSEEVAKEMAVGAQKSCGATYGIGITGVAGPDGGTPEKPVGTVWIAVAGPADTQAKLFQFGSDRRINRERSVGAALGMLWQRVR